MSRKIVTTTNCKPMLLSGLILMGIAFGLYLRPFATNAGPNAQAAGETTALTEGAHLVYDLRLATRAQLNLGVGPKKVDQSLSGRLTMTVTRASPGLEAVLSFATSEAQVVMDGNPAPGPKTGLADSLRSGFLARYSPDGGLESVSVPPSFDSLTEATAHQLAALLQVGHPPLGAAAGFHTSAWTSEERDGLGIYLARYTQAGTEAGPTRAQVTKEITAYKRQGSGQAGILPQPAGSLTLQLDDAGVLWTATGEQMVALTYEGGGSAGSSVTDVSLQLLRRDVLKAEDLAKLRNASRAGQLEVASQRPDQSVHEVSRAREVQLRELDGKTLPQLIVALDALAPELRDDPANRGLFLKFRALMLLNPEAAADVARHAATLNPESAAFQLLVGALAATETPEAQAGLKLLIETFSDRPRIAEQIIPNLALYEHLTLESEAFLRTLANESADPSLQASARLALGVAAGKLASQGETARAEALVKDAQQALAAAQHEQDKILALKTLGNSGAPDTLAAAEPLLHSSSTTLRQQAANALRFVRDQAAEAALLQTLGSDAESSVRKAAAAALSYRETSPDLLAAEQQAFGSEANMGVRVQLLRNIYAARNLLPAATAFVRQVEAQASEAQLRELAKELLTAETLSN